MADKKSSEKKEPIKLYKVFEYDGATSWGREPVSDAVSEDEAKAIKSYRDKAAREGENKRYEVEEVQAR